MKQKSAHFHAQNGGHFGAPKFTPFGGTWKKGPQMCNKRPILGLYFEVPPGGEMDPQKGVPK